MRVITFYSYKGGVGRTLACANFGRYLAKTGLKVVLVDMDFEAPGLDSKFFGDGTTNISYGLLDQITAFQQRLPLPNLSPIGIPFTEEVDRSGGRLQLIPAGNYCAPDKYHEALSRLDWGYLLKSEQGLSFWFDLLSRIETQLQPDVIVIDSRTGLTEVAGLCTQVLPDTVLLLTSTSPESMAGTRRMYELIQKSPLIKEQRGRRSNVELHVVVTRVPRPEDVDAFDRQMRQRFILEVPRLHYLFDDRELATSEYLAMDRSAGKVPSILTDYVQLFATLNPKDTLGYIKERLTSFREGLTVRKDTESRRVIQELLTLFPRAEVYLEAARYYRLVKEAEDSLVNYILYLKSAPDDKEIILEFAEVCAAVPQAAMTENRETVVRHLKTLGPNLMEPQVLSLFCALAKSSDQLQSIVVSIEGDPSRLSAPQYRSILFRALNVLQQWDKLVASATDTDLKDVAVQRILAKAYANLHIPEKALQIIHRLPFRDPSDIFPLMEILYDLRADLSKSDISKVIQENRHLNSYLRRFPRNLLEHPSFSNREDGEFHSWVRDLLGEMK